MFFLFNFSAQAQNYLPAIIPKGAQYKHGELLVKFKPGLTNLAKATTLRVLDDIPMADMSAQGGGAFATLSAVDDSGLMKVKFSKSKPIATALAELQADPNVELVQPNFRYQISTVPNDTSYSQLWGLKNTGQVITAANGPTTPKTEDNSTGITPGNDMGMESAWNYITNCRSTIVAVVDTGINYNQEDLIDNMWDGGATFPHHGYNYVDDTTDPMDTNGHGTHVAGTIGAVGNNGKGTTGVCWDASIMAVKVMNSTGAGYTSDIIQGINFAVTHGAKVINLSIGGPNSTDASFSNVITTAQTNGVLIVAAAGNSAVNNDVPALADYPCSFTHTNVLCVAALTQKYNLASFSNYGATSVDVGAPGINIVSPWPGTQTTVLDDMTGGWTFSTTTSSGWGYKTFTETSGTYSAIVNPANYDGSTQQYVNSTDDRAFKSYNLSAYNSAALYYRLQGDMETTDPLNVFISTSSGDPMAGTGTQIDRIVGTTSGARVTESYDISNFMSTTTVVGFQLSTDAATTNFGAKIAFLYFRTLALNANTYNVLSGTSMATPHVAGLATMLFAFNPNFTYADVINAIKSSGTTVTGDATDGSKGLVGKTVTGKAVNGIQALGYITAPTGVSAYAE